MLLKIQFSLQEGNQGFRGSYAQDSGSQGYGAGPGRHVDTDF